MPTVAVVPNQIKRRKNSQDVEAMLVWTRAIREKEAA